MTAAVSGWRVWRLHGVMLLALIALLVGLHLVSRPAELPGAQLLRQALLSLPGQAGVAPKTVTLPHILDDEAPPWRGGPVSYSVRWPTPDAHEQGGMQGLLLPRVGMRCRVWVNGHELFQLGWDAPAHHTVNATWRPILVTLPWPVLRPPGEMNDIRIDVAGEALERSGLWPFQLGPLSVLEERRGVLHGWQVTASWMMIMVSLTMGLMATFLWLPARERLFAYMAMASYLHVVRLLLSVLVEPPISFDAYFLLHRWTFTWYVGFVCLFMVEALGFALPWLRRMVWGMMGLGTLWIGLTWALQNYDLYRIWAGVLALVGSTCLIAILKACHWGRRVTRDQALILMVALFTLLTGVRDFLVVQLNFPGDADLRWTSLGSLALMFTLGWVLLERSTGATREVRRLNATLADTVAQREAELRAAFDQLRAAEKRQAVESERRRLVRDMHDGLGSQLVQTLNMVRSDQGPLDAAGVCSMLDHALDELRMTLDSLEPMDNDLPTALGTLRRRVEPALDAAGITLDWRVQEVPPIPSLDAAGVMHLFRALQEVFANVAKHAGATRVSVGTLAEPGQVSLLVTDNGRGFGPAGPAAADGGRGLSNIRLRAQRMGAVVRWRDAAPGVCVQFTFDLLTPLPPREAAAG